jgi:two-component system response regulator RegA
MATRLPPGTTILLVDDDEPLRERLARAFRDRGFPTTTAADAASALRAFDADPTDLAVLDLRLGSDSGLALLAALKARAPDLSVVMLSAWGSLPTAVDAVRLGAVDFVAKPATADTVLHAFGREIGEGTDETYEPPTLAWTEWEHLQRVLGECGGNISEAARRLRMHRRTLQRKLQKLPPTS